MFRGGKVDLNLSLEYTIVVKSCTTEQVAQLLRRLGGQQMTIRSTLNF